EDVEPALESRRFEEIRDNDRETSPPCFRAIELKGFPGIGLATHGNFFEKLEHAEDAALAALRCEFASDLVCVCHDVDAVEIRQSDVAKSCGHTTRIVDLRGIAVSHGLAHVHEQINREIFFFLKQTQD